MRQKEELYECYLEFLLQCDKMIAYTSDIRGVVWGKMFGRC